MATNIDIDQKLLRQAQKLLGKKKTKKETVNAALEEFVKKRRRIRLIELFGTLDYFDDYDYKKAR